jgi:hypothetical protein
MSRGGARVGAGRKKGSVTKATVYRQEMMARATADGISPLDVMIQTMRAAWAANKTDEALQAAVHAAPYVHPRLAASQVTVDDKRSAEQFTDAELEALARAGSAGTSEAETCETEPDQVH